MRVIVCLERERPHHRCDGTRPGGRHRAAGPLLRRAAVGGERVDQRRVHGAVEEDDAAAGLVADLLQLGDRADLENAGRDTALRCRDAVADRPDLHRNRAGRSGQDPAFLPVAAHPMADHRRLRPDVVESEPRHVLGHQLDRGVRLRGSGQARPDRQQLRQRRVGAQLAKPLLLQAGGHVLVARQVLAAPPRRRHHAHRGHQGQGRRGHHVPSRQVLHRPASMAGGAVAFKRFTVSLCFGMRLGRQSRGKT